jgi:acetyltransferase-like isoleucine patch superfamily enzyme
MNLYKLKYGYRVLRTKLLWSSKFKNLGRRVTLGRSKICTNPSTISIGDHSMITEDWILEDLNPSNTQPSPKIKIGKWCRIQHDFQCNAFQEVIIGNYCLLAPRVFICDADHIDDDNAPGISISRKFDHNPVKIGDNCWLGVNVTILKGVTLGDNSTVAAGAVVTKSFPENSIIGGIPARKIGTNKSSRSSLKDSTKTHDS